MLTEVQKARVDKGAALLDEKNPGWADRVNDRKLEMHSYFRCVLGQLYMGYSAGVKELFGTMDSNKEATEYGFFPAEDEVINYYSPEEALRVEQIRKDVNTAWAEKIKERKTA